MWTRKGTSRLPGCIAAMVAIVALAAPVSHAQCVAVRTFGAAGGKVGSTVVIDQTAFQNVFGLELAQFWRSGDPTNRTMPGQGALSTCPSQGVPGVSNPWYSLHGPSTTVITPMKGRS